MTFLIYLTLLTTAVITQVRLSMWVYLKIKSTCDSKSALKLWATESEQQTLLHWNKLILMSQQQILLYFISVMFKVIKKRERMREKKTNTIRGNRVQVSLTVALHPHLYNDECFFLMKFAFLVVSLSTHVLVFLEHSSMLIPKTLEQVGSSTEPWLKSWASRGLSTNPELSRHSEKADQQ